ncbi:NAD(P) transhydrogenase subunit alpha, partial [Endobacter medicaginis]|nr:NAD(P) transhydrogenase subunit alpha [Endobacter medicaginis]
MSSPAHAVTVGVLRERVERERRVALVPNDVGKLATRMRVVVETGAGAQAGHDDAAYAAAGASVL